MRRLSSAALFLCAATSASAQTARNAVAVKATSFLSFPINLEDEMPQAVSARGSGRFVWHANATELRAFDRVTRATTATLKGNWTGVVASPAGDQLALLRTDEGAANGPGSRSYLWVVRTDPVRGTIVGEPKRVSAIAADAPAFSPDGQSLAFIGITNIRRMLVIPSAGGPERVLFERGRTWGPVRWSPDAKWLYFAQLKDAAEGPMVVSRVPAEGGIPQAMTTPVELAEPGLTPDGRHIAALTSIELKSLRGTLTFFDLNRRVVGTAIVTMPRAGEPISLDWSGPDAKLAVAMATAKSSLHVAPALDGRPVYSRSLGDDMIRFPMVSPDGKRIVGCYAANTSPWERRVSNLDGSAARVVGPLEVADLSGVNWSPDSRYFLHWKQKQFFATDANTGTTIRVSPRADVDILGIRWRADGRSFRYLFVNGTPTRMKVSLRESTVDGRDRLVRELIGVLPDSGAPGYAWTEWVGDSALLAVNLGLVIPVSGGAPRRLYDPIDSRPLGGRPRATDNGRYVVVPTPDLRSIDVYTVSTGTHVRVALPAPISARYRLLALADHRSIAVVSDPTAGTVAAIHVVPLDGGSPRAIVTLKPREVFNDVFRTGDTRSIAYTVAYGFEAIFAEADLRPMLRP